MKNCNDLLALLSLKKISATSFSGESFTIGSPNVFGGQVLAQALHAAYQTVTDLRLANSLHAYFLEPGDLEIPILFEVEILRDGGSFSTRRVTAKQNKKPIFILAASFHKKEEGFTHQIKMPVELNEPENCLSWEEMLDQFGEFMSASLKSFLSIERPITFKPVEMPNPFQPKNTAPVEYIWFKLKGEIPTLDVPLKHQILTYISDYNVLNAAFNPNAKKYNFGNTQTASLDHSMWFYRDFELDDWMLFAAQSPNTNNARGFVRGDIFTRKGNLIASFAQEGLMRPK